jgi:hypothetical protein
MPSDQYKPAADPANTEEVLVVDPDALTSTANLLTDLPGPHSPAPTPPSAQAVGHSGLAGDISEFHQRYRAVALALATDNDTTAAHLDNSAAAYRRTEVDVASRLTDLRDLPAPRDPNRTEHNTDQNSGGSRNDDEQNERSPELYEI